MANMAMCALAIGKDSIKGTGGKYIRRAEKGEQDLVVRKYSLATASNNIFMEPWFTSFDTHLFEVQEGDKWRYVIKKGDDVCYVSRLGTDRAAVEARAMKRARSLGFQCTVGSGRITKHITVSNGWAVNWKRLGIDDSYDFEPYIEEHEDHVTLFFGSKWTYPDEIIVEMGRRRIAWQGAGCEDANNYHEYFGSMNYGLRIRADFVECGDGKPERTYFVVDESESIA